MLASAPVDDRGENSSRPPSAARWCAATARPRSCRPRVGGINSGAAWAALLTRV